MKYINKHNFERNPVLLPTKIRILRTLAQLSCYAGIVDISRTVSIKENTVSILMYHRVSENSNLDNENSVHPKDFEKQIKYISEKYNVISFNYLSDFLERKITHLPKNAVIVTFDDGYKDCYLNAFPILKKYKVPATFFIATDYINSNNLFWWDKVSLALNITRKDSIFIPEIGTFFLKNAKQRNIAKNEILKKLKSFNEKDKEKIVDNILHLLKIELNTEISNDLFLNVNEITEMSNNGMEFGCHTCSHPILTRISKSQAEYEIIQSKFILQDYIKKEINCFAYPSGTINDFNEDIKDLLKNSGFKLAVTTIYGVNNLAHETDLLSLRRLHVNCTTNIYLYKLELTGILDKVYFIHKCLKNKKGSNK